MGNSCSRQDSNQTADRVEAADLSAYSLEWQRTWYGSPLTRWFTGKEHVLIKWRYGPIVCYTYRKAKSSRHMGAEEGGDGEA